MKIWHPYWSWEDYNNGMYRLISGVEKKILLAKAIEFTGNDEIYGEYMMRVANEWPIACEHNLTDKNINQKAWIGHAACCLAINCPEDITRQAWGYLSEGQQLKANNKAGGAIAYWNEKQDIKLYQELEGERI